jgi:hypothetical protein
MKYILGVIGLFLVTIVAIILITRGRTPAPQQQAGSPRVTLSQHATAGTSASITTQGKLVGESDRRAIRIKITEQERRLEILKGYEEAVDQAYVFPNTNKAYETFLIALDRSGFSRERAEIRVRDERGVCPLGKRYVYEFKEFSQQLVRLWGSSCGESSGGTFGGSGSTIRKLFESQIPEYRKRIRGVKLTGA